MKPELFRKLMQAAGLKQGQAAKVLGVSRRTVIRWANGDTPIDERTALFIRSKLKPSK